MHLTWITALVVLTACEKSPITLREMPAADDYCLAAQKIVTQTQLPMQLVVHEGFDAFVKSKAIIDPEAGPVIQQYNWYAEDGAIRGISCKLKSADHLTLEYGENKAGPDGMCQDMNQAIFSIVTRRVRQPVWQAITFDKDETVVNEEEPGMVGPDWLAPYTATYAEEGTLHIASKGFIVDFTDPRFTAVPERFRGVHYCHFIAPDYLEALMNGEAEPGAIIGKTVEIKGPPPAHSGS